MTKENMMSKRKQLSPEEKVAVIRRHLVEKRAGFGSVR